MLIGRVVENELDHDLHAAVVRSVKEFLEVIQRAIAWMDADIIGDVVPIVLERRWKERQKPDAGHAETLQIVQPLEQARKIADAIGVAVTERLHRQLINDGVSVPEWIVPRSFHLLVSSYHEPHTLGVCTQVSRGTLDGWVAQEQ